MNQQQAPRPHDPVCPPAAGRENPESGEKLAVARAEARSVYDVAKAHLEKVKSADSASYLEQSRQRSGE